MVFLLCSFPLKCGTVKIVIAATDVTVPTSLSSSLFKPRHYPNGMFPIAASKKSLGNGAIFESLRVNA